MFINAASERKVSGNSLTRIGAHVASAVWISIEFNHGIREGARIARRNDKPAFGRRDQFGA